jgi:hypothetical protein
MLTDGQFFRTMFIQEGGVHSAHVERADLMTYNSGGGGHNRSPVDLLISTGPY